MPWEHAGTLRYLSFPCQKVFEVCVLHWPAGSHTTLRGFAVIPTMSTFKSKRRQSELKGGKRWHGSLFLNHCPPNQTRVGGGGLDGGCLRTTCYMLERCVRWLHAAGYPVPPLAACRQQFISGPGRSCKGKWEEIWSIWRRYKAHSWFAVFIKTWSRLHQYCHPPVSPGHWDWTSSPSPQQHHRLRANRPSFSDKVSSLLGRKELLLSSHDMLLLFLLIC